MHPFPHLYRVSGSMGADSAAVRLESPGLPALDSAPPVEFDGPGGHWSPETLLVSAIADCYLLSFKAVAAASKFPWLALQCDVQGKLDRIERTTLFTHFDIHAQLTLPPGADHARAQQLLEKSKSVCLISNSVKGEIQLRTDIRG